MRCPGQDTRCWKPGDIFEVPCPRCGKLVEFFKDESSRVCKSCGCCFGNPRLDLGCLQWCPQAQACLAGMPVTDQDPWKERGEEPDESWPGL
ncbi:MAG: hypothetical protein FJ125_16510, partial [Deltaproteobacteria bacterium]|nr:hypothetical protein [Deltaproteobacteria bacterium]